MRASFAIAFLLLLFGGATRADTQASIAELSEVDGAELAIGASLYVRIEYRSDTPVSLWARPYLHGREVRQAMSNASESFSGMGQSLGWFALTQAGEIDEIRVRAGGGSPYKEWTLTTLPVHYVWSTTAAAATEARPPWVAQLLSESSQRSKERARQRASEPAPAGDVALFGGFMLVVIVLLAGSVGLPILCIRRWHGGWRLAACVPLALMAFVILRIISDTTRDPTSHNLWPFEIVMYGACAVVIIAALRLARKVLGIAALP